MKFKMPKFDNGAFGTARAIGDIVKETARIQVLKGKIANRQYTNRALRRMNRGQANTASDSMGMARGVSKKKKP
jgi:hypothetical protein